MDNPQGLCPRIQRAFELLSRKWVGLILHALRDSELHYCDLQRAVPDLSDRILSLRMKELEAEGIVQRIVHTGTPIRVSYCLTERGRALSPILDSIAHWAETYTPPSP